MFRGQLKINSIENLTEDLRVLKSVHYQNLFQTLPIATVVLDLKNEVVICNEAFERFSGFRLPEIIGNDLIDVLIPIEALESAKFLFGRLLLGEKVKEKQLVKISDGSVFEAEIDGAPILQNGEQVGLLVCIMPIVPENELVKDFERFKRLTEISQLIGAIGHELRNPLCIIKNSAYLVEKKLKEADIRKYLAIIRREAETSNKIIANLLHFIRQREPQKQWIDPAKPVKEVLMRYPLPENIELEWNEQNPGARILVDPDQIEIVLLNLITNAVAAMASGGKLKISLTSDDNRFLYQIADTGCGIAPNDLTKIFQPLFSTKRNGIGLGLSITKQLVEANQGKISVQSEVGVGTIVTLEFPNPSIL
ncbi:MAG: ATP-binding protein [candidate division WOR-3 bacterium]